MKNEILIGADHAGFKLKEKLKLYLEKNYKLKDISKVYNKEDDYPDIAKKLAQEMTANSKGILICGTGQGISIVANKFKGIYCSLAWNKKNAKHSREHLDSNVISLPGDLSENLAKEMVKIWLKEKDIEKRHKRRIRKIKKIEKEKFK